MCLVYDLQLCYNSHIKKCYYIIVTQKKGSDTVESALQSQPEITTLEQYEALPEEKRVEVFDGIVYDMASPSRIHQTLITDLITTFYTYIQKKNGDCEVFPAPFDVILSKNPLTIVQPDIMIVCDKVKLDEQRCNGAPDFIIEIVSLGNPSDDYIKKAYYYKNYGVREYWIVDPKRKTVTVNYFEKNEVSIQLSFESAIRVNIFDDLYINFTDICKRLNI